ncbi:MAG: glycosyltransferase [Saprospiraceae bacterium]
MLKLAIIGPAYPLRGGLASFDERLCKAFKEIGWEASIYTFSLQYPSLLFPGTSQYSDEKPPVDLDIHVCINSINPFNWIKTGRRIRKYKPNLIIVRYWLPFMGPCLGTILRLVKMDKSIKIICIADNVIPHERRPGDKWFTKYFISSPQGFITMSEKVQKDLLTLRPNVPNMTLEHPLYDNFGTALDIKTAREKLNISQEDKIVLFFGFIRNYKGLDLILEAFSHTEIINSKIKLLIAGEFYEDSKPYLTIIENLNLSDKVLLHTHFIPDSEIRYYFSAADVVVQPYRHATQSGVSPLAYHFEKPMIVSNVGGLPAMVPHMVAGIVCEPTPLALSHAVLQFFELDPSYFIKGIQTIRAKLSWHHFVNQLVNFYHDIS